MPMEQSYVQNSKDYKEPGKQCNHGDIGTKVVGLRLIRIVNIYLVAINSCMELRYKILPLPM